MKRAPVVLSLLLLFLPLTAFAAPSSTAAGFAPGALWLSSTAAKAGEVVKIYTVLYDSTSAPIRGDVQFDVDAKPLQTVPFSLSAGQTQIVSAEWTATAGSHSFSASLTNVSGVSSTVAATKTNVASISVADPSPTPTQQVANAITATYASSSPSVQNALQKAVSTVEGVRLAGVTYLKNQLAAASTSAAQGDHVNKATPATVIGSSKNIFLGGFWVSLLSTLLTIFSVPVFFYAVVVFCLYVVYLIIRGYFRYRRRGY